MKKTIFIILSFFLALSFITPTVKADVWEPPPSNPPTGNRPRPIDVSSDPQTKAGNLTIQGELAVDSSATFNNTINVTGSPSHDFAGSLINFTSTVQSALNIEANLTRVEAESDSVVVIDNSDNTADAAISLLVTNTGMAGSVALQSQNTTGGWSGYFYGPFGIEDGNFLINNNPLGGSGSGLRIISNIASTHYNWKIGAQSAIGGLDFTRSDAIGGTTFTSPKMVITNDGKVGIGTDSPGNVELYVYGPGRQTALVESTNNNAEFKLLVGTENGYFYLDNATSDFFITASRDIIINPARATNYVGINTLAGENPAYELDVNGDINVSDEICINGDCIANWAAVGGGDGLWTDQGTYISADNTTVANAVRVYDDGNIIIEHPTYPSLTARSSDTKAVQLGMSTCNTCLNYNANDGDSVLRGVGATTDDLIIHSNNDLLFTTWDDTLSREEIRLTVEKDGNLVLNNMFIAGSASLDLDNVSDNLIYGNIDSASIGSLLLLQNESNDRFKIESDGDTYIEGTLVVNNGAVNTEGFTLNNGDLDLNDGDITFNDGSARAVSIDDSSTTGNNLQITAGGSSVCFSGETRISTPNGVTMIKDLKIGDTVLGYDIEADKKVEVKVLDLFSRKANSFYILNNHIQVTPEHPFYTSKGWKKVKDLAIGDKLFTADGWLKLSSKEKVNQELLVYNLSVESPNTYFAEGVLVHNKDPEADYNGGSLYLNGGQKQLNGTDGDVFLANYRGNVGIGTTNPSSKLGVNGDVKVYGGISVNDDSGFSSAGSGDLTVWDGLVKICDEENCANGLATDDGDLYVEDDLEVDGDMRLGGNIQKSDGDTVIEFSNGNVIINLGE